MGAEPFWYFVPYDPNTERAFEQLRTGELKRPAEADSENFISDETARKVLGTFHFSEEMEVGSVSPLPEDLLDEVYGIEKPDRAMAVENLSELFEQLDRWQCVAITVYKDGAPSELLFAGYSED